LEKLRKELEEERKIRRRLEADLAKYKDGNQPSTNQQVTISMT
jgi:hypothetical protein